MAINRLKSPKVATFVVLELFLNLAGNQVKKIDLTDRTFHMHTDYKQGVFGKR